MDIAAYFKEKKIIFSKDENDLEHYGKDWTSFYPPNPSIIAFPKTAEEVQQIIAFANTYRISIVPSGGRTGLSGAAVATKGELVLSLEKMNALLELDEYDQTIRVEAGATTQAIQDYVAERGYLYPVDFASSGSSQIGGNIATNAGGIKVVKYGMTRDQVVGLKVITGAGEYLELNKDLIKNATGYALHQLFIGSEGTLGVIVEATLKIVPAAPPKTVCLLALPHLEAVFAVLYGIRQKIAVFAFEAFTDACLSYVMKESAAACPVQQRGAYYIIIEFEKKESNASAFQKLYESYSEKGFLLDDAIAETENEVRHLWQFRENIAASIAQFSPYKNDLSVRVSQIPNFIQALEKTVKEHYPDFEILWYGHIADGNIHLNILKPKSMAIVDFKAHCDKVSPLIFQITQDFKGSISAEHGVGLLKKDYLHYSRSETEIAYMKAIKHVFDPNGIMNPGKVF